MKKHVWVIQAVASGKLEPGVFWSRDEARAFKRNVIKDWLHTLVEMDIGLNESERRWYMQRAWRIRRARIHL